MRIISMLICLGLMTLSCRAYAADPNGLYLMTRMVMGSSLEIAAWYFKNGQVCRYPKGDLAHFDFKKSAAEEPSMTGSFTTSGNNLSIKWANGTPENAVMEPDGHGNFYWQMGSFCPAETFKPNTRIDGVFSGGASAGYGKAANATTITLSSNGQYKLEQAGSVHSDVSNGTMLQGGSSGSETGTYQLSGVVLTLNGPRPRQVLSFPYDDGTSGPAPRRLFYDGAMLKRIK